MFETEKTMVFIRYIYIEIKHYADPTSFIVVAAYFSGPYNNN